MMSNPNQPEQLSSLDKFKRRLERRSGKVSDFKSTILPPKDFKVNKNWGDDDLTAVDYRPIVAQKTSSFLWRLFLGSSIFFLATVAVAVYVLFFSANIVSGNNIDIVVKGPLQIRSGDELNLQTTIVNRNKVVLNSVNLVISYPPGTMDPLSPTNELPIWREKLSDIGAGQTVDVASRAVIFGGQNTKREVKIILEYRIPDSNALFTKEKIYTVGIGSSSLDLSFKVPTEINLGKEFNGTLKVVSNAQSLLRNCAIRFEWPNGFNIVSSDPKPVSGNNVWFLGDLVPGMEKEINFVATLNGQSGDVKPFKIQAGFASGEGHDPISIDYGSLFQTINLKKDFVSADVFLADESGRDVVVFPGGDIGGDIVWTNNLDNQVINGSLELKLEGAFVNKRTVRAGTGFYNSINDSISWDERTLPDLQGIPPGEGGQASFNFSLLPIAQTSDIKNKEIKFSLTFRGTRIIGENQTEEVVSQSEKTIKVSTLAKLAATAIYSVGPFNNTGPIPPVVGKETTYTVKLTVTNTLNNLGGVKVRTVLPPSVRWLGVSSPLDEKISYDQTSGEVVWDLGQVEAGTGSVSPVRQAFFQVSLIPSLSQLGKSVNLTESVQLVGQDAFTGALIKLTAPVVTNRLLTDPEFVVGQDAVSE